MCAAKTCDSTHTTQIRERLIEDRTYFWVTCSCGWEDPGPGGLLCSLGDAQSSERDHVKYPPTKIVNGQTLYRVVTRRGHYTYVSVPEND